MTEQDNNLSAGNLKEAASLDEEFIPNDALPLCPNCLKPCNPLQNYCVNCDSNEVINPLASYMPFVRIRFNIGMVVKAWRKMLYDKEASILFRLVCLLIIVLFALNFLC
ncbi:MAG: hypothetical protein ACETVZ_06760 [Phycisphaerae bacterium]